MQILSPSPDNLKLAAQLLKQGDVVGMPTETVYGLAGNAFNIEALTKIFSVKERPTFDPLIIHVGRSTLESLHAAELIDKDVLSLTAQQLVSKLIKNFWPGPLTLVLPKSTSVPDLATSGLSTVALRMPSHPVALALIEMAGTPLAAPSANRFGRISPTSPLHVEAELGDRIALTLDGGPCEVGLESTVLAVGPTGSLTLLRPGKISRTELETITGERVEFGTSTSTTHGPQGPGMLESHYAPRKGLTLLKASIAQARAAEFGETTGSIGVLLFQGSSTDGQAKLEALTGRKVLARTLSAAGDVNEAARNLFSELRLLDSSSAETLFAEPCLIETGLGAAIADRLKRASARNITEHLK